MMLQVWIQKYDEEMGAAEQIYQEELAQTNQVLPCHGLKCRPAYSIASPCYACTKLVSRLIFARWLT